MYYWGHQDSFSHFTIFLGTVQCDCRDWFFLSFFVQNVPQLADFRTFWHSGLRHRIVRVFTHARPQQPGSNYLYFLSLSC